MFVRTFLVHLVLPCIGLSLASCQADTHSPTINEVALQDSCESSWDDDWDRFDVGADAHVLFECMGAPDRVAGFKLDSAQIMDFARQRPPGWSGPPHPWADLIGSIPDGTPVTSWVWERQRAHSGASGGRVSVIYEALLEGPDFRLIRKRATTPSAVLY